MKQRLSKSIKRLEKLKLIREKKEMNLEKTLNSFEVKVFRSLREKYNLSFEINDNLKDNEDSNENELSEEAKITLERIKKGEDFKI